MIILTDPENNKTKTFKSIREMTKLTGLTSKFIKYHIALGKIYVCNKLLQIEEYM